MKILIVDDEPIANFITCKMFRQISPEIEIADFTDPLTAIKQLPSIDPYFIFLDINMPRMDGWAFLDKMINEGLNYRVFILSSSVSNVDQEKAAHYTNVIECLQKPLRKEKLQQCITIYNAE